MTTVQAQPATKRIGDRRLRGLRRAGLIAFVFCVVKGLIWLYIAYFAASRLS